MVEEQHILRSIPAGVVLKRI